MARVREMVVGGCACPISHGVRPGSFTFSLVDAYIYHEYLKQIFSVDAVCVQRAVTLSRQWTRTAFKAAERVKRCRLEKGHIVPVLCSHSQTEKKN